MIELYALSASITTAGLIFYGQRIYKEFFGCKSHEIVRLGRHYKLKKV